MNRSSTHDGRENTVNLLVNIINTTVLHLSVKAEFVIIYFLKIRHMPYPRYSLAKLLFLFCFSVIGHIV